MNKTFLRKFSIPFFAMLCATFLPGCFSDFVRKEEYQVFESSVSRRFNRMNYDLNITKGAINENRNAIDILQEQLQEVSSRLGMINKNIRKVNDIESQFNNKLNNMMDEVIRENERLIKEINKTREITVQNTDQTDTSTINVYNKSQDVDLNTGFYHHVEFGESLSKIAKRYQVPIDSIIEANGLSNPDALYVGQKLFIPAPEE